MESALFSKALDWGAEPTNQEIPLATLSWDFYVKKDNYECYKLEI